MLENKIKILLVVRWPNGGIRTFIRYVYRYFEPDRFQITILGPDDQELGVLKEDLKDHAVEIIRTSEQPSTFEFYKAIFKNIISGDYDLIHSNGFTSGICSALPAFLVRKPHILTSHDVLDNKQFKGAMGCLKKAVTCMALSLIPVIHSVSYDAQGNLLEFFPFLGRKAGRCMAIPNGIEVERFLDVTAIDLRAELAVNDETFLIGFLGRFMSQKGFTYLVDAIEELSGNKSLPKFPLVVSFGEGCFVREEKARIADRGLTQYFRFLPFTPNVAGVIKALDVVAMPSLWEACPLLPMEVMVTGAPLIATNCIGLREVVRNTPAYVIPARNSKALADGIVAFMKDEQKDIFREFSKDASNRFNVKNQAEKLRQLILDLVSK